MINIKKNPVDSGYFRILFSPLDSEDRYLSEKAECLAKQYITGIPRELELDVNWEFGVEQFAEQKHSSLQWLIKAKQFYREHVIEGNFQLLKFVWHKKPLSFGGWGPKMVIKYEEKERTTINYLTKVMTEEKAKMIESVGNDFNLFQPNEQIMKHSVKAEVEEHATIFSTIMERGDTLDVRVTEIYKQFTSTGNSKKASDELKELYNQICNLYLQTGIDHNQSLGWVKPNKLHLLFNPHGRAIIEECKIIQSEIPFLIPVRWRINTKNGLIEPFTILHGDEWGSNFIAPSKNQTGSVRPIDFEDALIQDLDNDKHSIELEMCKASRKFKTGTGPLAYRTEPTVKVGDPLPLFRYSVFCALGRLLCATIQKLSQENNNDSDKKWIEIAISNFFYVLEKQIDRIFRGERITIPSELNNFQIEDLRRGFLVRTIIAAREWGIYWENKQLSYDMKEYEEEFKGKWRRKWADHFREQLVIEAEWQILTKDNDGHPAQISALYGEILSSAKIYTSTISVDIDRAVNCLNTKYLKGDNKIPVYNSKHAYALRRLGNNPEWDISTDNLNALDDIDLRVQLINRLMKLFENTAEFTNDEKMFDFIKLYIKLQATRNEEFSIEVKNQGVWEIINAVRPEWKIDEILLNFGCNISTTDLVRNYSGYLRTYMQEFPTDPNSFQELRQYILGILQYLDSHKNRAAVSLGSGESLNPLLQLSSYICAWRLSLETLKFNGSPISYAEVAELYRLILQSPSLDSEHICEPVWLLQKIKFTWDSIFGVWRKLLSINSYPFISLIEPLKEATNYFFNDYLLIIKNSDERIHDLDETLVSIIGIWCRLLEKHGKSTAEWLLIKHVKNIWEIHHRDFEEQVNEKEWCYKLRELFKKISESE